MKSDGVSWVGVAKVAGATGGAVALASVAASFGIAWYFARVLLTPEREKPENTTVLEVGADTITLRLDAETAVRGNYGLWLDGGRTHVRVGDILEIDPKARRVVRSWCGSTSAPPRPDPPAGPATSSSAIRPGRSACPRAT
ncbi:hypothetical protein [Mobilicoccus caccae]|uniref:Uncharacterized protein n=1 Tax=Mobilicoccus caccae TaxID=1859295 RepID=A0ABQ6ISR4_9MICO|nr:hypothetical protein [Mobilicoccus caccae]GMA39723.1 hypothetical protein GCM10025883_17680 [Mobilicoccus caccae]